MGKPKHYDPDWVIELDENHPDPRVAAKYADENARKATLEFLQRRLRRLLDKPTALTEGEARMFMILKQELGRVKADIEEHKDTEADD